MKIFWQGRFIEASKARVGVSEGPYLDGSALVETMQVRAGRILNFKMHLLRIDDGARALLMPAPDAVRFSEIAVRLIRMNRFRNGALRCRYFRDSSLLVHPLPASQSLKIASKGIRMITTPVRHYGPESIQARLKANSMLPNLLSRWESQAWAEDGLRLTEAGFVAEGTWTNILVKKGRILKTPPLSTGVLEGTTRALALTRWRKDGGKVLEAPLTRYDLYTADRAWVCSSLRGLLKIAEVDGRTVGRP